MFNDPAPAPPIAPASIAPPSDAPASHSTKWRRIAAVIAATLIGLGSGGYAYYRQWVGNPERVLPAMVTAMQDVHAVAFTATVDTSAATGETHTTGSGAVDFDAEHTVLDVTVVTDAETFTLAYTASGDEAYMRLSDFPAKLLGMEDVAEFGDVFADRWFAIGDSQVAEALGGEAFADALAAVEARVAPTAAEEASFEREVLATMQTAITVTERLGDEAIDGVASYHYAFTVDEALLVQGLTETAMSYALGSRQAQKMIHFLERAEDVTGELWVGKADALVRRVTLVGTLQGGDKGASHAFALDLTLSDFNEDVTVTTSTDAVSLAQLLEEMLAAAYTAALAAEADDDGDGLVLREEERFGTDPANPDSDGDGYADGAEIDGGYNPLGEGKLADDPLLVR